MRRPRREGSLRPLLLLLPFAALLSVATISLRSADRSFVSDTVTSSSGLHRLAISTLDVRALDAAAPLHAAAARAFRSGGRLLRDVLSSSSSSSAPAPPPAGAARCPASVAVSGAQFRGVLPLPCGLTLGSHVTVVGVPRRVPGVAVLVQFAVELRGEGDGDAASTILHFNPRLRGDWSGRPVIEQNTRFRSKWGPALRCEGRRSRPDEEIVDDLVKCEEWAVDGNNDATSEELKRLRLRIRGPGQKNKNSMIWPYPFVEGEMFVLTLNVGLEGYHVHVDGKHFTSFPYRVLLHYRRHTLPLYKEIWSYSQNSKPLLFLKSL